MKSKIARYVLALRDAAANTRQAADRPIYEKFLAEAAVLLALAETAAPALELREAIQRHERLWGHAWPVDDAYKVPSAAWQEIKQCVK